MKKVLFLFTLALIGIVVSCNRNQKAVKKLEGDWEEVSINGQAVADSSKGTMHFGYCKLKKDEWCTVSYTDSDGYNAGDYDYQVSDKGEVMTQRFTDSTKGSIEISGKIKELTDEQLILELNYFGFITTTEYKKK